MDISKAWGYGAVFRRSTGDWQGFFVPDPEHADWKDSVAVTLEVVEFAVMGEVSPDPKRPVAPQGALAGSLVDVLYAQDWNRVGIFASALSKITGSRFWVVAAESDGEGGFNTDFTALKATTAEEARDVINMLGAASQVDAAFNELMRSARAN